MIPACSSDHTDASGWPMCVHLCVCACTCVGLPVCERVYDCVVVRESSWPLPGHLVPVTTLCACVSTSLAGPAQLCPPIRYLFRPLVGAVTEHQKGPCRWLMQGVCQACVAAWWWEILEEGYSLLARHTWRGFGCHPRDR